MEAEMAQRVRASSGSVATETSWDPRGALLATTTQCRDISVCWPSMSSQPEIRIARRAAGRSENAADFLPDPVECAVAFLAIETELEVDGRWIAEIPDLPGVMCYGRTKKDARRLARLLAIRVIRDRLIHGEKLPAALSPTVV